MCVHCLEPGHMVRAPVFPADKWVSKSRDHRSPLVRGEHVHSWAHPQRSCCGRSAGMGGWRLCIPNKLPDGADAAESEAMLLDAVRSQRSQAGFCKCRVFLSRWRSPAFAVLWVGFIWLGLVMPAACCFFSILSLPY